MSDEIEMLRALAARVLSPAGQAELEDKLVVPNIKAAKMYLYGAMDTLLESKQFPAADLEGYQKLLKLTDEEIAQVRRHPAIFHV